jgi:hypothetical protein
MTPARRRNVPSIARLIKAAFWRRSTGRVSADHWRISGDQWHAVPGRAESFSLKIEPVGGSGRGTMRFRPSRLDAVVLSFAPTSSPWGLAF